MDDSIREYLYKEMNKQIIQYIKESLENCVNLKETGSDYPCGPCELPLICSNCGTIITEENVVNEECDGECEICDWCGIGKCPTCGQHWHCGGCI